MFSCQERNLLPTSAPSLTSSSHQQRLKQRWAVSTLPIMQLIIFLLVYSVTLILIIIVQGDLLQAKVWQSLWATLSVISLYLLFINIHLFIIYHHLWKLIIRWITSSGSLAEVLSDLMVGLGSLNCRLNWRRMHRWIW